MPAVVAALQPLAALWAAYGTFVTIAIAVGAAHEGKVQRSMARNIMRSEVQA